MLYSRWSLWAAGFSSSALLACHREGPCRCQGPERVKKCRFWQVGIRLERPEVLRTRGGGWARHLSVPAPAAQPVLKMGRTCTSGDQVLVLQAMLTACTSSFCKSFGLRQMEWFSSNGNCIFLELSMGLFICPLHVAARSTCGWGAW